MRNKDYYIRQRQRHIRRKREIIENKIISQRFGDIKFKTLEELREFLNLKQRTYLTVDGVLDKGKPYCDCAVCKEHRSLHKKMQEKKERELIKLSEDILNEYAEAYVRLK